MSALACISLRRSCVLANAITIKLKVAPSIERHGLEIQEVVSQYAEPIPGLSGDCKGQILRIESHTEIIMAATMTAGLRSQKAF